MIVEKKDVQTGFNGAGAGLVPVEATFLAAAPCNAPLPDEYLRAQDRNEDAWRTAMDVFPSLQPR